MLLISCLCAWFSSGRTGAVVGGISLGGERRKNKDYHLVF